MKITVYNTNKESVKQITLADSVFKIDVHNQSMFDSVITELASRRQGTHSTQTKSEVKGTGKKPWAQKKTGRARAGSLKNPHMIGGGVAHGPRVGKNYKKSMNKKSAQLGLKSALSNKRNEKSIMIIESFNLEAPSTKILKTILMNLGLNKDKLLLITNNEHDLKSASNLPKVLAKKASSVSVYDVINAVKVLATEDAIKEINGGLK